MNPEELRTFMLGIANMNSIVADPLVYCPMMELGDTTWKKYYKLLKEFWANLGVDLCLRKKSATKDSVRHKAEQLSVPTFMKGLQVLSQQYPEEFATPRNWMNLDEQAICEQPSNGKTVSSHQMPGLTGGMMSARAAPKAPKPVTLVTITYADGSKSWPVIMREGRTPYLARWFEQMPPGLTHEDIDQVHWCYGETDRMTLDKFLDILEHHVHPEHMKKKPTHMFWIMDAPT